MNRIIVNLDLFLQVYRLKQRNKPGFKCSGNPKKVMSQKKKLLELRTSLAEFLPHGQLQFVMSQLNSAVRRARGRRWTNSDKAFALSLLHASPKTYRKLRHVFSLPSTQTLKKAMQNVQVDYSLYFLSIKK